MGRRRLFSGSENFVFYDFFSGDHVDENVFAYSNSLGGEHGLIIYHSAMPRPPADRHLQAGKTTGRHPRAGRWEALGVGSWACAQSEICSKVFLQLGVMNQAYLDFRRS
jgi:hypothetical protein